MTTQFYYGTINPVDIADGDDFAGGTQDNGTQVLVDGNAGNNAFFDPAGGDGGYTEIDNTGAYMIQSYTGNTHIYRNFPSLGSATLISSQSGGRFINQAELDKNLDILYTNASTSTARIERISEFLPSGAPTDNTILTNALLNSSPTAFKVSPYTTGSSKLFVGLANGRLLKINFANFNPGWSNISGTGFVGSISDIEFGQSEQEIFVTMHNYGVTSIWFSGNGGDTWSSIEGNLPELPVKCILQNPLIPQELIIGTELGVWATADYTADNPTWVQAYNGMSDVTVLDLDLRAADNTILASTYGRGMFTSQFTDTALSVMENNFVAEGIMVYPTISNGEITIKSQNQLGGDSDLQIYNISGQKVASKTFELNTSGSKINLDLNAGIYFIAISNNGYSETKKIIIR